MGSEELTKHLVQISIVHFNRWLLSILELDLSDQLPTPRKSLYMSRVMQRCSAASKFHGPARCELAKKYKKKKNLKICS